MSAGIPDSRRAAPESARFGSQAEFYRNSAYAVFPQEHRLGGSFGQTVFSVDQGPIDLIDSAVPDFIVTMTRSRLDEISLDVGDGVRRYDEIPPGTLGLYPSNAESRTSIPHAHSIVTLSLPMSRVDAWLDDAGIRNDPFDPLYGQLSFRPDAVHLMDAIWHASDDPDGVDHLLIDGLTLQLLANLANLGGDLSSDRAASKRYDQRITRVLDYVESHLGESLSVGDLAIIAAMSPGHFSRVFKAVTREPVWCYVRRRRCARAREMLQSTGKSIAEIAHVCGFSSQAHLTHCFRQAFGVTPGALRRG